MFSKIIYLVKFLVASSRSEPYTTSPMSSTSKLQSLSREAGLSSINSTSLYSIVYRDRIDFANRRNAEAGKWTRSEVGFGSTQGCHGPGLLRETVGHVMRLGNPLLLFAEHSSSTNTSYGMFLRW